MIIEELSTKEDYEPGPIMEKDYSNLPGYTEYARINRNLYDDLNNVFIDRIIELVHENKWRSFLYPDPYVENSFNPVIIPLLEDVPEYQPGQTFILDIGIPELIHKKSPDALVPVRYRITVEADGQLYDTIADYEDTRDYDPKEWAKAGIELVEAYWFCGDRPGMT